MTTPNALGGMKTPVLLWHEQLHEYFGQRLVYYFAGTSQFSRRVLEQLSQTLKERLKNPGFCTYLLFGQWDILLRMWLRPKQFSDLSSILTYYPGLYSLGLFEVQDIALDWASVDAPRLTQEQITDILNRHGGVDCIREAQEGSNVELEESLKDDGLLLWNSPTYGEQDIKFFTTIGPPPSIGTEVENSTREHIKRIILESHGIERPSLYFGRGIAWALVKGVVKEFNYSSLGEFVLKLSDYVNQFGMKTTTSIVLEPSSRESDCLNEHTLSLLTTVVSPEIEGFLPQLADSTSIDATEKLRMAEYVLKNRFFVDLGEGDREFVREFLNFNTVKDNKAAWGHMSRWFVEEEGKLAHKWNEALKRFAKDDAEEVQKELRTRYSVPKDKKHVTLGHYMVLYADLCQQYRRDRWDAKTHEEFITWGGALTEYRNRLAHGSLLDPLSEWQKISEALRGFLPHYRLMWDVLEDPA